MPSTTLGAGQAAPSRSEKRYNTLLVTIEWWQRKLEKADKTVRRAILTIAKLERQRRRLQKKIAADERAKADALVMSAVKPEPVEITAPVEALEIPPFLKRDEKPKAKPKRKAKAA